MERNNLSRPQSETHTGPPIMEVSSRAIDSSAQPIEKYGDNTSTYCKAFLYVKPATALSNSQPSLYVHNDTTVFVRQNSFMERKFVFDKVFTHGTSDGKIYLNVLLPLLETVLYEHKDATLVCFGPKNTGKSSVIGSTANFHKTQNVLNEALNYFYNSVSQFSGLMSIQISCFEIFANTINDLLISDDDPMSGEHITSRYAKDFGTAVGLLKIALRRRKGYEENQSHVFVNIEVTEGNADSTGEISKGVLTLIDLAGNEWSNSIGAESLENSKFEYDGNDVLDQMNYTKMTDCGRLMTKMKLLSEVVGKSLYTSIKAFKSAILSVKLVSDLESPLLLDSKYTLVQIILQNLKTDSRIYIMAHVGLDSDPSKTTDTTLFARRFKATVGKLLYEREKLRKFTAADATPGTILGELKNEVPEESKVERSCNSIKETVSTAKDPIPPELMRKLAELAKDPSEIASIGSPEQVLDITVSKINGHTAKVGEESCLSGVFSKEDRVVLENIKENAKEIHNCIKDIGPNQKPWQGVSSKSIAQFDRKVTPKLPFELDYHEQKVGKTIASKSALVVAHALNSLTKVFVKPANGCLGCTTPKRSKVHAHTSYGLPDFTDCVQEYFEEQMPRAKHSTTCLGNVAKNSAGQNLLHARPEVRTPTLLNLSRSITSKYRSVKVDNFFQNYAEESKDAKEEESKSFVTRRCISILSGLEIYRNRASSRIAGSPVPSHFAYNPDNDNKPPFIISSAGSDRLSVVQCASYLEDNKKEQQQ